MSAGLTSHSVASGWRGTSKAIGTASSAAAQRGAGAVAVQSHADAGAVAPFLQGLGGVGDPPTAISTQADAYAGIRELINILFMRIPSERGIFYFAIAPVVVTENVEFMSISRSYGNALPSVMPDLARSSLLTTSVQYRRAMVQTFGISTRLTVRYLDTEMGQRDMAERMRHIQNLVFISQFRSIMMVGTSAAEQWHARLMNWHRDVPLDTPASFFNNMRADFGAGSEVAGGFMNVIARIRRTLAQSQVKATVAVVPPGAIQQIRNVNPTERSFFYSGDARVSDNIVPGAAGESSIQYGVEFTVHEDPEFDVTHEGQALSSVLVNVVDVGGHNLVMNTYRGVTRSKLYSPDAMVTEVYDVERDIWQQVSIETIIKNSGMFNADGTPNTAAGPGTMLIDPSGDAYDTIGGMLDGHRGTGMFDTYMDDVVSSLEDKTGLTRILAKVRALPAATTGSASARSGQRMEAARGVAKRELVQEPAARSSARAAAPLAEGSGKLRFALEWVNRNVEYAKNISGGVMDALNTTEVTAAKRSVAAKTNDAAFKNMMTQLCVRELISAATVDTFRKWGDELVVSGADDDAVQNIWRFVTGTADEEEQIPPDLAAIINTMPKHEAGDTKDFTAQQSNAAFLAYVALLRLASVGTTYTTNTAMQQLAVNLALTYRTKSLMKGAASGLFTAAKNVNVLRALFNPTNKSGTITVSTADTEAGEGQGGLTGGRAVETLTEYTGGIEEAIRGIVLTAHNIVRLWKMGVLQPFNGIGHRAWRRYRMGGVFVCEPGSKFMNLRVRKPVTMLQPQADNMTLLFNYSAEWAATMNDPKRGALGPNLFGMAYVFGENSVFCSPEPHSDLSLRNQLQEQDRRAASYLARLVPYDATPLKVPNPFPMTGRFSEGDWHGAVAPANNVVFSDEEKRLMQVEATNAIWQLDALFNPPGRTYYSISDKAPEWQRYSFGSSSDTSINSITWQDGERHWSHKTNDWSDPSAAVASTAWWRKSGPGARRHRELESGAFAADAPLSVSIVGGDASNNTRGAF